jgi:GNAT superfamily N-acetyltransferase
MLIRRATDKDAPAILALVPRLVAFGPPSWREPSAMTNTDRAVIEEAMRVQDKSKGDDPILFVAEVDGAVAGFVHLRSFEDFHRRRPHGHVADLIVADGHEGKGIATALLAKAEEWARAQGYDWLSLGVFEGNVRAEKLYRKFGFHRDVIRMIKPL